MAGKTRISLRLASATALALVLAACGQQKQASIDTSANVQNAQALSALPPLPEVQPLAEGPATPVRYAPPVSRLPSTQPLGYAEAPQDDRYAWIDRANWINDTIGDAPPDYGFDYDGVEPWAWQTSNDYLTYAEPIDDGYRYYYYEPGADYPYLVRDPYYSYGYRDGRIVTVYDRQGRYLAVAEARRQADAASRYYARARALRIAAREREGRGVAATQWAARRPTIAAARNDWNEARQRVPDWRAYRQRHAAEESRQLMPERVARERAAERFATWQRGGEAGRPPRLYGANDGGNRREDARQTEQARQQAQRTAEQQRNVAQQRAAAEQQRAVQQRQQQVAQQIRDSQRMQVNVQRDAQRQHAAADQQRMMQERLQQRAARRDQARRERVIEPQRAAEQRGQQMRQQRDAQRQQAERQRMQQRAAQQQQVQQRAAEQRGQQMRQQRDAQRQQAEQQRIQQRAAQQQQAQQRSQQMQQQREAQRQQAEQQRSAQQQRQQAQQQAAQQRASQQAQHQAAQQQRAAQQAQQRAAMPRPQPGQGPGREHGHH